MPARVFVAAALGFALAAAAGCSRTEREVAAQVGSSEVTTPETIDNFQLIDHTGRAHELYRMTDARAVVMVMQGVGCPIVQKMTPDLKDMYAAYKDKGVEFLMLNSNLQDTREAIAAEAESFSIEIPVLKDEHQLVGEHIGAVRTAEVYVIEPGTWKILYHGPLNDRLTYGRKKARAENDYVADVLDAMLAGEQPPVIHQTADGCIIDFPAHRQSSPQPISYVADVAPILEEKCVSCHQQGGIGPFAMDRYETVQGFAPMIREAIMTGRMPPWQADPHVGKFIGDKSLSSDEIRMLAHWVDAGAPRGEGADPLAAVKHVAPRWPLGEPDVVLDIPAYTIPASGVVDYQRPYALNPLKEGRWLKASTVRVEQRQAVHHALTGYLAEAPPDGVALEAEWGASVGGYAVGAESTNMPANVGTWIPPGGAIGFQMHYTPFGREATDRSQMALYFYGEDETPDLVMRQATVVDTFIRIPANVRSHTETAYLLFPKDALLYSAFPHAHYRSVYTDLTLRTPDGKDRLLLRLPSYDFAWQRHYEFAEPIVVPAGSKLIATYTYDNSTRNPANPDPDKEIVWGDQSFEEMFFTSLRFRWLDETVEKPTDYDVLLMESRLVGMLDDNLDGMVQEAEFRGELAAALHGHFALLDANGDGGLDTSELASLTRQVNEANRQRAGGSPTHRE